MIMETLAIFSIVFMFGTMALNIISMLMHVNLISSGMDELSTKWEKGIFLLVHVLIGAFLINFWYKIR